MSYPLLVCLDPGLWRCGLAVFQDRILVAAAEPQVPRGRDLAPVVRDFVTRRSGGAPVSWVVEAMTDYEGHSAREATLQQLRDVATRATDGAPVVHIRASTWKGQVPKHVHHARLLRALSEAEASIVYALPRFRDALDAVGLGLYYTTRTGRGGVTPRRFD